MTNTSPLSFVHKVGKFGDTNKKSQNNILKVSEINGLLIFQISQYKNSSFDVSKIKLDGLSFPSSLKSNICLTILITIHINSISYYCRILSYTILSL